MAGPYANKWIRLELNGDLRTLQFTAKGMTGHYEPISSRMYSNTLVWVSA